MNKSNFLEKVIQSDTPGNYVVVKGTTVADLERALALFNKRVYNSGLMEDLRKNSYYEKPSAKRHLRRRSN